MVKVEWTHLPLMTFASQTVRLASDGNKIPITTLKNMF